MVNFIIGYFIVINVISYIFIWINIRTKLLKSNSKWVDMVYLVLSILGGFVGIMLGSEMFNYRRDEKIFRRYIPLVIFMEICIVLYIIYKINR